MANHSFRDGIEGKVCTKCGEWKPLEDFYRHNSACDKLTCRCKQCIRQAQNSKRGSCVDCGVDIKPFSSRCISCAQKRRRQEECGYAILNGVEGKHCTQCGMWKPLSKFHKRSQSIIFGVRAICKECHSAYNYAYGREHRVEQREYSRQWAAKNPDRARAYGRESQNRRRARLAGVLAEPIDERAIYERCHHRCVYCGRTEDLTLDHVVPIAKRGSHVEDNLVVACRRCNSEKYTRFLGVGKDCWLPWDWHGPFPYDDVQQQSSSVK